jgi:hypothetical protein
MKQHHRRGTGVFPLRVYVTPKDRQYLDFLRAVHEQRTGRTPSVGVLVSQALESLAARTAVERGQEPVQ